MLEALNSACKEILKLKKRVLIALTGLHGSGKSTLGKELRRKGFGDFKPYQIAVIDDGVMSINLFFIRPRVKIKCDQRDELRPFFKFIMPFVKVVIYASANPLARISKCDILCILSMDEEERIAGIYKRNSSKDPDNTQKHIDKKELDLVDLEYKFKLEFKSPIKRNI
ncbi:hypothetical protein [Campylobacter concisus]|uniref:Uncharacterized protein n=1 Tax=Campylobacter concisus UNSW2 TaxID=1242965 RepID=U2FLG0_9BACT|nr:hypothetical protein [Campylobacter concisus]ERJ31230.1 hypothetical protein UNSW2_900 [Campylobacter concisus UNSW2]